MTKHTISVYIDTGDVFEYGTDSSGREHAQAIISGGYRTVDEKDILTWYPPHRIVKVKVSNSNSLYKDTVRGT